jgi:hypothetical protein
MLVEKGLELLLMEREQNILNRGLQVAVQPPSVAVPVPAFPAAPAASSPPSNTLEWRGSTNTKSLSVKGPPPTSPYKEPTVERIPVPPLSVLESPQTPLQKVEKYVLDDKCSYRLVRDSRRLVRLEPWNEKVLGHARSEIAYENSNVQVSTLESQKMLVTSSELRSIKFPQIGIRTLGKSSTLSFSFRKLNSVFYVEGLVPVDYISPDPSELRDSPVVCVKLSPGFKMGDEGLSSYKRLLKRIFEFEEKALDSFSIVAEPRRLYVRFYTRRAASDACLRSGSLLGDTPIVVFIYSVDESEMGNKFTKF